MNDQSPLTPHQIDYLNSAHRRIKTAGSLEYLRLIVINIAAQYLIERRLSLNDYAEVMGRIRCELTRCSMESVKNMAFWYLRLMEDGWKYQANLEVRSITVEQLEQINYLEKCWNLESKKNYQ
ncbi:MAG: hypothetical protein AAF810_01450 [Cyanobacteria bacterium P01_D01_bin.36]